MTWPAQSATAPKPCTRAVAVFIGVTLVGLPAGLGPRGTSAVSPFAFGGTRGTDSVIAATQPAGGAPSAPSLVELPAPRPTFPGPGLPRVASDSAAAGERPWETLYPPTVLSTGPLTEAERTLLSPTRVTVEMSGASPRAILEEVQRQLHAPPPAPGLAGASSVGRDEFWEWQRGKAWPPLSLSLHNAPAWEAVSRVAEAASLGISFDAQQRLVLSSGAPARTSERLATCGPFLVVARAVPRAGVAGDAPGVFVTVTLRPEGKLTLLGVSRNLDLVEATDDRGRSWVARETQYPPPYVYGAASASGITLLGSPGSVHTLRRLRCVAHALIRTETSSFEVADLDQARPVTKSIDGFRWVLKSVAAAGAGELGIRQSPGFLVRLALARDGRSDEEWRSARRMTELVSVVLADREGRPLTTTRIDEPGAEREEARYTCWAPDYTAQPSGGRGNVPGGPYKLTVTVAKKVRNLDLDIDLADVPVVPVSSP